jgi:hypothetical protein
MQCTTTCATTENLLRCTENAQRAVTAKAHGSLSAPDTGCEIMGSRLYFMATGFYARAARIVLSPCRKVAFIIAPQAKNNVQPNPVPPRVRSRCRVSMTNNLRCSMGAHRPLPDVRYRIVTDNGQVITGTTDPLGKTQRVLTYRTSTLKLQVMET